MKILAVNAGSSSLKVQLLEMPSETLIAKAQVERIGLKDAIVTVKYNYQDDKNSTWEIRDAVINNHPDAVKAIMDKFTEFHIIDKVDDIKGVGHRVVQGGEYFSKAEIVTKDVENKVLELAELAPHHNKAEHDGYLAFKQIIPNAVHTMIFDTAFHQTIPEERYIYPLPYHYYKDYKIRRYGAHGTSHKYIASVMKEYYKKDVKLISCHLGSGASICAIENGKSVDTSMGFTPLGGIAMGTRSGDLDPSILTYIMNKEHLTPDEMNHICNYDSGLLGTSNNRSSDMRDIDKGEAENDKNSFLARKVYCTRIAQFIGSYFVELGGCDAIVLTAGVGENSISTRSVLIPMISKALGIEYTIGEKNKVEICGGKGYLISNKDSKIDVFVIPTNEELMMCKDTYEIIKDLKHE